MSMMRRPAWRRALRSVLRVGAVAIICIPIFVVTAGAVGLGALVYGDLEGTVPEARPTLTSTPSKVFLRNPDGSLRYDFNAVTVGLSDFRLHEELGDA